MKRIPAVMIFLLLVLYGKAENPPSDKDKAVACIKRWEGWHRGKMPYIGYGHRLLPHETLTENLSEAQADSLLRCDLERCLKVFRKYGKDSLLLSLLGFNVGCYRLIGNGKIPKSKLIQKLDSGNRDIYKEYVSFRCYRGKVIPSIERRRKEEFERKYSINSLVYWVTYVHNVVYSFYRSMIYCYINSTQRCAGSIVIDIIPTNGADKRKFFPFAPYFPVTNVIKRYFYPYFPAIIGIKGYSFPYFPYLSGIMKIKTALYSLFSRLDWHKTVVFPCLGEIYEGIRSLSWEIPVT